MNFLKPLYPLDLLTLCGLCRQSLCRGVGGGRRGGPREKGKKTTTNFAYVDPIFEYTTPMTQFALYFEIWQTRFGLQRLHTNGFD